MDKHTDNVNQIDSTLKTAVDTWYKRYMTSYTSKLEDTIFCNDRSIRTLNGWNPNGGRINDCLEFPNTSLNGNLSCTNETDKFSLSNSKAQLTYPVGILTIPDLYILGNGNVRKTGQDYWVISPDEVGNRNIYCRAVNTNGALNFSTDVYTAHGVRPAISLKPETEYISGTGSMADPYVVQ